MPSKNGDQNHTLSLRCLTFVFSSRLQPPYHTYLSHNISKYNNSTKYISQARCSTPGTSLAVRSSDLRRSVQVLYPNGLYACYVINLNQRHQALSWHNCFISLSDGEIHIKAIHIADPKLLESSGLSITVVAHDPLCGMAHEVAILKSDWTILCPFRWWLSQLCFSLLKMFLLSELTILKTVLRNHMLCSGAFGQFGSNTRIFGFSFKITKLCWCNSTLHDVISAKILHQNSRRLHRNHALCKFKLQLSQSEKFFANYDDSTPSQRQIRARAVDGNLICDTFYRK